MDMEAEKVPRIPRVDKQDQDCGKASSQQN